MLAAFDAAPAGPKRRFLILVAEMDTIMQDALAQLRLHGGTPLGGAVAEEAAHLLKHLVARTAGVMNGVAGADESSTQDAVDALMTR